jgi:signal transduction histidine kinase
MFVVAIALLGLIALLATLQYKWLGRISDAEREGMRATLNTRASGFAKDFDSELTRAYLLFQVEPVQDGQFATARVAALFDRWQATARYPRMIKDVYLVPGRAAAATLERFNQTTRFVEPAEWPESMRELRAQLLPRNQTPAPNGMRFLRTLPPPVWDTIPALVVPAVVVLFSPHPGAPQPPVLSYTVLLLDREYLTNEMLPALARQHFRGTGDGFDYQVAVVSTGDREIVYHSAAGFSPAPDANVDAAMDLFQVRTQEFGGIAAEVRRFVTTFSATLPRDGGPATVSGSAREEVLIGSPTVEQIPRGNQPFSIFVQQTDPSGRASIAPNLATARSVSMGGPRWRLLVKHPSGSLEVAVSSARRRNLIISSSILAVLGASVGLLVLSTRRAQELARQQMEFVAAVSHELRTPLAVIRSAGENLADGVVHDEAAVRKYGDLVRNEGRRLTDLVEQILDFAGIESGQLGFALRPVAIPPLLHEIVESSRSLIDGARIDIEYDIPDQLPPVLGDEAALRRVFQNLIANAIKYGKGGGWIGIRATHLSREVHVTVADRGIGIAPAEQPRIFEPFYRTPDVIAAQIQGAGLGLSLVKRIVQAHGGRVSVKSAPGSGSDFTVVLPAASEEPVGRAAMSEAHGHGSHA